MKKINRIGQTGNIFLLVTFVIGLVVAGVAAMVGLNILDNIDNTLAVCNVAAFTFNTSNNQCFNGSNLTQTLTNFQRTAGNVEFNASISAKTGIKNLSDQFPNIGLVVAAVFIIGLLLAGFALRGRR